MLFKLCSDLEFSKLIRIADDEREVEELTVVRELFYCLRNADFESIYEIVSGIGGCRLRNELVPNANEWNNF